MKSIAKISILFIAFLIGSLSLFSVLPSFAQDTPAETTENLTIVTGAVTFGVDGSIIVAGITIAPAGAFNPSILSEGDLVIITGVMLNETTLQATAFEFFDDEQEPEATPEPTTEVTPEATAEQTPEATLEVTPEATAEMTPEATLEVTPELTAEPTVDVGCNQPNHPVAMKIANTFGVTYEEVIALHCAGNGFGNIVRAYTLAAASTDGSTAQDFIDRHHNGEGWGQIVRDSGVNPSDLAPGRVLKDKNDDTTDATPEAQTTKPNNGNGNGNGNNGGGNGNGNGGGNGNGNNGGGNGNGNGNGGGNSGGHGGGKP